MKTKFAEKSKKANSKRHVGAEIRSAQGITLIALVITIVVMIILAGLAINLTLGDNGILTKASEAKVETTHSQVKDAIILAYSEYQIELQTGSKEKEISKVASIKIVKMEQNETEKWSNFMQFLTEKEYIDEAGIINTEKLLGKKVSLGNGTGEPDVYKIVQQDNYYVLNYYDKSSNVRELWKVEIGENEEKQFSFTVILGYVETSDYDSKYIYQYSQGMTWREWIDSEYNNDQNLQWSTIVGRRSQYKKQV